jgi:dienelactone hydrolase
MRSVAQSLLLAAAVLLAACRTTKPAPAGTELLPPTGKFAIGRVTVEWPRDLKVHLFYPAHAGRRDTPAPYHPQLETLERFTDEHFERGFLQSEFGEAYPLLKSLRGHAYESAPAASGRFPVVVFTHGGGIQVLFYSALLEDLASHGYVVAAVEHPYDADLIFMSDGRVIEQRGWGDDATRTPAQKTEFHRARHAAGAENTSFVLDQLAKLDRGEIRSPLAGRLDLAHVAAAGHSYGGKASIASCGRDPRWTACVNLDGGLDQGDRYPATRKPVLTMFGGPSPVMLPHETEETFAKRRERNATFLTSASNQEQLSQHANVADLTLVYVVSPGFSHFSYYDLPKPEAVPWGDTPARSARNLQIIRATMRAFLDTHLKGRSVDIEDAARGAGGTLIVVRPAHATH